MCPAIQQIIAAGYAEGYAEGKAETEAMMKQLIDKLLKAGRINDISRIVNEANYLEEQYKAFNITPQDSSSQTDGIH